MPNMGITKKSISAKGGRIAGKTVASKKPARAPLAAREASTPYQVTAQKAPLAASGLADALFTTTQQRVLGLLFGLPDRSFFANELIALTGSGSGAVQRELARLESSGLVTAQWIGNQKHYQANKDSPIFSALWSIVQNTVGVAGPIQEALRPLAAQIRAAFVFGSVAKKTDSAASDIDVMVISDNLSYADLFSALEPVITRIGRPVNPTVLSEKELAKRLKAGNAFIGRVLEQPKIWLIGGEGDLGVGELPPIAA
jgi:predicted nucleotidyltransferase